jgi:hypothetical protein
MAEYIDKQAFLDHMMGTSRYFTVKFDIEEFPVADVAPVVHGRWDGNDCTVCKLPWNYNMVQDADDWGYFDPMPDYCPNCGAKMDGGAENGNARVG